MNGHTKPIESLTCKTKQKQKQGIQEMKGTIMTVSQTILNADHWLQDKLFFSQVLIKYENFISPRSIKIDRYIKDISI